MSLSKYLRESVSELHKVTWPTRKQAIKISVIVLSVTFTFAIALGFFDAFLSWAYKAALNLAN